MRKKSSRWADSGRDLLVFQKLIVLHHHIYSFVWDESKYRSHRRKHGVSFESAARVFDDPEAISYLDRVIDGEERWHTIGLVGGVVILLVVHTARNTMAKNKSASSRREKRVPANELLTTRITDRERRALQRLAKMPDSKIDFSDVPDTWPPPEAQVGRFYRPIKQLVSLRVDADVLAWFRSRGRKYQTYMNEVLRREMQTRPRSR